MGLFSKKVRQLEKSDAIENIGKIASDRAVDFIKNFGGEGAVKFNRAMVDNFIVFTNASGGTGASTIASNVAYMAAAKGYRVLMIDLNIMCPIQHTCLNIQQQIEAPDLVSYLLGREAMGDCINSENVYSIMYANNRSIDAKIECNGETAINNFETLITKCRGLFDLIIVDCPMSIDDMLCNNALYNCDAIYMVWDEGLPSISNTDRLRRNMAFTGIDAYTKLRIILNKRTYVHYSMYPLNKLNIELMEILPFDVDIIENSTRARIFCAKGQTSSKNAAEFARRIDRLTDKILRIGGVLEVEQAQAAE